MQIWRARKYEELGVRNIGKDWILLRNLPIVMDSPDLDVITIYKGTAYAVYPLHGDDYEVCICWRGQVLVVFLTWTELHAHFEIDRELTEAVNTRKES